MTAVLRADISRGQGLGKAVLGSEVQRAAERCAKRMELAIQSYGGKIVDQGGDYVVARFPSLQEAVESAVAMQRRVGDLPAVSGIKLGVRAGICSDHALGRSPPVKLGAVASRLAKLACPAQILFCLPEVRLRRLSREEISAVQVLPHLQVEHEARKLAVCDIDWSHQAAMSMGRRLADALVSCGSYLLRHGDRKIVMDGKLPRLSIGRHPDCDVVLESPRVSRHHAFIEVRGDGLVIMDQSSNGTYISCQGQADVFLHKAMMALSGAGEISLGIAREEAKGEKLGFQA